MKRLFIIFTVFVGLAFLFACEKEHENPVLDLAQILPAELISPQSGGEYVLLQDNEDDFLFTIGWTAADYVLTNISSPRYAIEMDVDGNDFKSPATIATLDTLSFSLVVSKLNDASGVLGLEPEVMADVNMRIRSFIPNTSDDLIRYSNHITFAVTPFEFKIPPIYILGDGTPAGWNNNAALELEHVEDGTYSIVVELSGGGFFKFISVLGQWAPQWGTDANPPSVDDEGVVTGNLVYRPDEGVPDPPAIPRPEQAGDYRVTADTIGLTYKVEPMSEKVFIVGDAVDAGWNLTAALEMTKTAPGKFYTILDLDGSRDLTIQFVDQQNQNAIRWGSESDFAHARSRMVESGDRVVKLPSQAGTYKLEVNLATQSYRIIKQ